MRCVIRMVRLSNHFIKDLEKIAAITKKEISVTIDLKTDCNEFKTRYNTARLIETDMRTKKRL